MGWVTFANSIGQNSHKQALLRFKGHEETECNSLWFSGQITLQKNTWNGRYCCSSLGKLDLAYLLTTENPRDKEEMVCLALSRRWTWLNFLNNWIIAVRIVVLHHNKVEIDRFSRQIIEKGEKYQDLTFQMDIKIAYNFDVWLSTDNLECIFCEYIFIWNLKWKADLFLVVYILSFL